MSKRITNSLRIDLIALTPSLLSGLIACMTSAVLVLITVGGVLLGGIHISYIFPYDTTIDAVDNYIASNQYLSNAPVAVFWGLLGLVAYFIIELIVKGIRSAREIGDEMHYVNANRVGLLGETLAHLLVRMVALFGWWFLLQWMLYYLTPHLIVSSRAWGLDPSSGQAFGRAMGLAVAYALGIHGLTVLLRLIVLRPRLFGQILL